MKGTKGGGSAGLEVVCMDQMGVEKKCFVGMLIVVCVVVVARNSRPLGQAGLSQARCQ
jgi:hypothetical protein